MNHGACYSSQNRAYSIYYFGFRLEDRSAVAEKPTNRAICDIHLEIFSRTKSHKKKTNCQFTRCLYILPIKRSLYFISYHFISLFISYSDTLRNKLALAAHQLRLSTRRSPPLECRTENWRCPVGGDTTEPRPRRLDDPASPSFNVGIFHILILDPE